MGNLFIGCLGVGYAFQNHLEWAAYMIWLAGAMDFADGLVARLLGVNSEIGKQLDSLADVVSFGLLPSVIVFMLFNQLTGSSVWPYFAFLIVIASAYRLARFNLESNTDGNFQGLPTPAGALLISSLPFISLQGGWIADLFGNALFWILFTAVLSYLLVSNIPLFGLKFKNLSWDENRFRWIFIGIALVALVISKIKAIPIVIIAYIGLSILWQYQARKNVDS